PGDRRHGESAPGGKGCGRSRLAYIMHPGLLGIEELDRAGIEAILARAKDFQPMQSRSLKKLDTLRGKMIVNLFYEASTRTRTSFEIAAKRLGADAVSITASGSSVSKGESLMDTLNTLVAVELVQLAPGVRLTTDIRDAIQDADVIMMLRVQLERQHEASFPASEYFRFYGLRLDHLDQARPDAIVMHPGPINRGRELSSEVADFNRSVILNQVENGIAVRMAVLERVMRE